MKTAEEILEEKLRECDSGFERGFYIDGHGNYNSVIEAMKEYAKEVAKEALKNAQDKLDDWSDQQYEVHPPMDMIIDESNIPKL